MHKDELIFVHLTLFYIKQLLEAAGFNFQAYDELHILPTHIHMSKTLHRKAIALLCIGILRAFWRNRIPVELREILKMNDEILRRKLKFNF